ncbi:MAG: chromosome segregation protein SMC [Nitrospirae bacterium]|nr:chromosome segregation protein SMC [Nitrospirota bacterium]
MRIKQIELAGFKSFSDKTVIKLHHGVTCIVGPNGCGKSNVVDAFKWVLGEQSVKSLRGDKMEEVIFQGSSTVKQRGMAEVTLQIAFSAKQGEENGNGSTSENNTPQDESSVSRRLYRSGESEYLHNKSQCRLRDIKDLFLDTGLDVKSYSIMDQGKVSEIINAKPQDRRFLIEEVAGVMKYKVRKAEALSKLESSKQNLQRINDIVFEVKRQINSLDRQVKKAERYKRLNGELKNIELRIAKKEFLRLCGILEELSAGTEQLREADSLKRSALSTLENQVESKRLELAAKERALADLENSLYNKEKDISESEKRIAILKTTTDNIRADIIRLSVQQGEFDRKNEELEKKLEAIEANSNAFSSGMSGLADELRDKREVLAAIESSIAEKESEMDAKRKELFRVSEIAGQKRNELHKLQSSFETLQYRESASARDLETVSSGIAAVEESIRTAIENVTGLKDRLAAMQSEKDDLKAEIEKLNNDIESRKNLLATERETLASNMARLESLKELVFDKSLMDVLSEAVHAAPGSPEASPILSSDCLVLSDVISTERQYERAIEAALSERINSLILKSVEDILAAATIIKDRSLGRTALIYTGFNDRLHVPGDIMGELDADSTSADTIIGRASDFINLENNGGQGPAGLILDNTLIVRDLQAAIALRQKKIANNYTLVTLDGEVIDRDSVILAGQVKDILKRKREIKELHATIVEQQSLINGHEKDLSASTDALSGKKESLIAIENSLVGLGKELSVADHSMNSLHEEAERMQRKLGFLNSEITTIAGEKESLNALITAKSEEIRLLEEQVDSINKGITELQDSIGSVRTQIEAARSEVTELQLSITSYREKLEALQREKSGVAGDLKDLDAARSKAVREAAEAEEKLAESTLELQRHEEAIKAMVVDADIMRREKNIQKEAIETENNAVVAESNSLKTFRLEIDELSAKLAEANAQSVENRLKAEHIESSIRYKYGVEIKSEEIVTEGSDPVQDEEQVNQLSEKIRDLGPVNLGTIEEYEDLKKRYEFLTQQQQDLTLSIAELEEAISRINASTRRKLREAYDALRAKFSEVFMSLFGGGKADIILGDEENILESGLEIIAQPPGKKLQNLNLLSGGEKALTSLSLLFAGFLIKPSPLCILDEVDAPLDESNTVRFAQMIKGLSNETQFIIITHNRSTMEVADYLYGITMEEAGVSKAISMQFAEVSDTE